MNRATIFGFVAGFVFAVAANLAAQLLINKSRTVRRFIGP
jgi:ABC-type nitrate/sulfonate/bicarbonate transport system permease component